MFKRLSFLEKNIGSLDGGSLEINVMPNTAIFRDVTAFLSTKTKAVLPATNFLENL